MPSQKNIQLAIQYYVEEAGKTVDKKPKKNDWSVTHAIYLAIVLKFSRF